MLYKVLDLIRILLIIGQYLKQDSIRSRTLFFKEILKTGSLFEIGLSSKQDCNPEYTVFMNVLSTHQLTKNMFACFDEMLIFIHGTETYFILFFMSKKTAQ